MQRQIELTNERAVSPVVGVALLIAIAVILAAVIGAVVLGLGTGGADTPQAQLQADFVEDNGDGEIVISHDGGEPLEGEEVIVQVEIDGDDERVDLDEVVDGDTSSDLTAGGTATVEVEENGNGDVEAEFEDVESVAIIWEDPDGQSEHVLATFDN